MKVSRYNRRRVIKTGVAAAASTALLPAISPAVANAKSAAIQTSTNLRVMVWGRPDRATRDYAAYERINPEGAKSLTVEPIVGGEGDNQVAEQFRLMLSAGGDDVPDIIYLNRIQVPEFAAAGVLMDLTDLYEPYRDQIIDSALELSAYEDSMVAVPAQLKSKIWYYRADIFEQAGINPDEIVTIDDFVDAGHRLHEAVPESFIYNLRADPPGYVLQDILTSYAPVSFYDEGEDAFVVTSHPGFRGMFETLGKFRDPNLVAPVDDFSPDWANAFASGTIASSLINEWMSSFLPDYVPDQSGLWRVHLWPTIGESNQGSDAGGSVFVIPKQAKNPEAAFEYLAAVHLTEEGTLALTEIGGETPVVKSAREKVATMTKPETSANAEEQIPWAPDFFGDSYYPTVFEAQEKLAWIGFDPRSAQEIAIMQEWAQRFVAGDADVESALEGLQNDLTSQIGDPWLV